MGRLVDPSPIPAATRRGFLLGSTGILAAGVLAACGGSGSSAGETVNGLRNATLVYGVPALDPSTVWFAAIPQKLGYYEQAGLNVKVNAVAGGSASIAALVAGQAQFATQSSQVIFTSVDKGVPLKGFMCEIPGDFIGLAVMADSPITQESQLKEALRGRTIGTNAVGGNPELEVKAVLAKLGLDPENDVKFLAVGTGTPALNALQTGRVQALGLWAMVYADIQAQGAKLRIFQPPPLPDLGFEHTTVTMQKTIDDDPELVAAFSKAIAQSLAFLSAAPPEQVVKLHYELYPSTKPAGVSDADAVAQGVLVLKSLMPYLQLQDRMKPGQLLGDATDAQINSVASLLHDADLIKGVKAPDAYFSRQFLESANKFERNAIVAKAKGFTA